ncbi:MAG: acyl-CoA dehydratase activase-related protein [Clostridia bacterium]
MRILLAGLDAGSTTAKLVILDAEGKILYNKYERHLSQVRERSIDMLKEALLQFPSDQIKLAVTGSAGLGLSRSCGLTFVQEVFATAKAVKKYLPNTDAVIELGGEDAKIIFFKGGLDQRMNGSCAGGTGAFIDQMATLINVQPDELDRLSMHSKKLYPIASRCGVFAKSDIQPLLNQGATKEDVSASIFQAIVNQTITGLAQGRRIEGRVAFLGGPLFYFQGLRKAFKNSLVLEEAIFPEDGRFYIGMGAALCAEDGEPLDISAFINKLEHPIDLKVSGNLLPPLFRSQEEYQEFQTRHESADVAYEDIATYSGDAFLGIDSGSTTTKMVLITPEGKILFQFYESNRGNPIEVVLEQMKKIRTLCGDKICIKSSAVTGYGEALIKNAFGVDLGLVETMAHFSAASFFQPEVDFILDIGGQDIKCFHIKSGAIDSIMLNEACSSGCGSFIETFAKALGYEIADFAKLSLFAQHPVDLGTRCTVFMNSSVKQAQKDGAGVDEISAGLSISVVKNALYKVIRIVDPNELGKHMVVQGGTFLNDAVLRSFEQETGRQVVRPKIAGLMGAFGAALYVSRMEMENSTLITQSGIDDFSYTVKDVRCKTCSNSCPLSIIRFNNGASFTSGNRCERSINNNSNKDLPNLFKFKYEFLRGIQSVPGKRGKIGIPLVLNMYENLPFWHAFLTSLGFEVVLSEESSRSVYTKGQDTIPSDTVCYPAKLAHGLIESLIEHGIDTIFYPCMPYNFKEQYPTDNHYNCPVVAYYPELLSANMSSISKIKFIHPYFGLHRPKDFVVKATELFGADYGITRQEIAKASKAAYQAYADYKILLKHKGHEAIRYAREHHLKIILLTGRPYHIDPEINHGIDRLISSYNLVVVSDDALTYHHKGSSLKVLNQWTYHSRMYHAAHFAIENPDCELVQLISFGCGLDAITSDEIKEILQSHGKLYTQLKIDDIDNLGAVKIRIRSLLAVVEARRKTEGKR